jgi:hypothetical protein
LVAKSPVVAGTALSVYGLSGVVAPPDKVVVCFVVAIAASLYDLRLHVNQDGVRHETVLLSFEVSFNDPFSDQGRRPFEFL